jgi:hypothetical protein
MQRSTDVTDVQTLVEAGFVVDLTGDYNSLFSVGPISEFQPLAY